MNKFCRDTILYRQLIRKNGESFADFTLSGVLVREIFAADPDMTEDGTTTVYFFPGMSRCTDSNGRDCEMPLPKAGDLAVLHAGGAHERTLRAAEAGYFTADGGIGHIRLKLR